MMTRASLSLSGADSLFPEKEMNPHSGSWHSKRCLIIMHTPFAENQQRHNKDIPVSKSTNESLKFQLLWLDMKSGFWSHVI